MTNQLSYKEIQKIFWEKVLKNYKLRFFICFVLIICSSLAELLTISSIIPLLSILSSPETIFSNTRIAPILDLFSITSSQELIVAFSLFFCFAALLGAFFRSVCLIYSSRMAFSIAHQLSLKSYENALQRSYAKHISTNSADVVTTISYQLERVVYNLIFQAFLLVSALVVSLIILAALVFMNPVLTISIAIVCSLFYLVISLVIKKILLRESEQIVEASAAQVKIINESFGGIRDVLINNAHSFYYSNFESKNYILRRGQAINVVASMIPRYLIEGLGFIMIVGAAYFMSQQGTFASAVPLLGALAIGAQKLLGLFQQLFVAWSAIMGNYESLQDVSRLLTEKPSTNFSPSLERLDFNKEIVLKDIRYAYNQESNPIFQGMNFQINAGDRIGIIGETGSGKSTFVDIVAGLLFPDQGSVLIDNIELNTSNASLWMHNLAYVPQNIYLSDETILENIAIGVSIDSIDLVLAKQSLENASLSKFIDSLPNGVHTKVGERGVKLSGGQKQRIGIARALYKRASLIIFDEATSALDESTENAVMEAIDGIDSSITMLIIAHRTSTLKNCNKVIELKNGNINLISQT